MNDTVYTQVLAGEPCVYPCRNRVLWKLEGQDRTRYLNGQVTQDVTKLAAGQITYGAVCNAKGRMEGDLFIAAARDFYLLDSDLHLRESLGSRLEKYLISDDATFSDLTETWNLYHYFGPAPSVSTSESFLFSHARFGLPGHDLWLPCSSSPPPGNPVNESTVELLRLEAGLPRWGAELNNSTLPPEAGLEARAISYTKGCYVGQETIARIKSIGHVNRCLVFLQSENDLAPQPAEKITLEGKEVGTITSAGFSPRLKKGIALGYVQRHAATLGTALQAGALKLTVKQPL